MSKIHSKPQTSGVFPELKPPSNKVVKFSKNFSNKVFLVERLTQKCEFQESNHFNFPENFFNFKTCRKYVPEQRLIAAKFSKFICLEKV